MRKMAGIIVAATLAAATVGIWAKSAVTTSGGAPAMVDPSTAAMSPLDLMEQRGKSIPTADLVDPF